MTRELPILRRVVAESPAPQRGDRRDRRRRMTMVRCRYTMGALAVLIVLGCSSSEGNADGSGGTAAAGTGAGPSADGAGGTPGSGGAGSDATHSGGTAPSSGVGGTGQGTGTGGTPL